jgi:hypothetical protein
MSTRELNSDDIEKLRNLLRSSAWNEVMKPALQARREVMANQLIYPARRSEGGANDDELRGRIAEDDWVLTRFEQAVGEFDHNRQLDERDAEAAASR